MECKKRGVCWNRVTFVLKDDRWPGAWSDCSFDPHTQCTHTHKLYINIFPPVFLSTHCTLEFISFSHQPSITLPTRLPSCPSITSFNLRISLSALHLFLTIALNTRHPKHSLLFLTPNCNRLLHGNFALFSTILHLLISRLDTSLLQLLYWMTARTSLRTSALLHRR